MVDDTYLYYDSWNGIQLRKGKNTVNNNLKHFNMYEKKELSFLHMKYLFMKHNGIRELTNEKLMEWMESLGWVIRFGDETQRRATHFNTIEELEQLYGGIKE